MKQFTLSTALIAFTIIFLNCKKNPTSETNASHSIHGKITDSRGQALGGAKITIEHTVWYNSYVLATANAQGEYVADLPSSPAGSWTAKAQIERNAYGQTYKFDLQPGNTDPFYANSYAERNFSWKLSGARTGGGVYGAHVDVYLFGTGVEPTQVKLRLTPIETTLVDGSAAAVIEKNLEDVAGTYMVRDIPIGKYKVKAIYPGKTLLLDNRHDNGDPAIEKEVVFGKNGYLGETEYNIEFWLSE